MKSPVVGICRMCGGKRELRHSHIVPELCYLASYDDKHRAQRLVAGIGKQRAIQKGIREHLLCEEHEQHLGKLEREFKGYWYGNPRLPERVDADGHAVVGFTYAAFKLFHLSILWRAGIASIAEFDSVRLGPYEGKLRDMLLSGDAGDVDCFPLFGQIILDENRRVMYGMVTKPQVARLFGTRVYYMCYAGCEWTFLVTEKAGRNLEDIVLAAPQKSGQMPLLARDYREINSVSIYLEDDRRLRRQLQYRALSSGSF